MTRITSTVLIILLLLNGSASMMEASGLSDDLGVDISPGVERAMDDAISTAKDGFASNAGPLDTLFALFISGMKLFETLTQAVFAAPTMFMNMGFPSWFVFPVFAPMYIVSTLEIMYVATGRETV